MGSSGVELTLDLEAGEEIEEAERDADSNRSGPPGQLRIPGESDVE